MSDRLSHAILSDLPVGVSRPRYARSSLSPGILHFGVGNFHRAHQAAYLDELLNTGEAQDWAIAGAGLFEGERVLHGALREQDWLTTVVAQDQHSVSARVIGSMVDFILPTDMGAILEALSDPRIRIVSLTITEGGYFLDPATGQFDLGHPDIQRDGQEPDDPRTVFGLILAGLRQRRASGIAGFTVMSCDNVPHNGDIARSAIVGLASLIDAELAEWVETHTAFPNSMVDRITPATTDRQREFVEQEFGFRDKVPVFCEPFRQWVVEDKFPTGRPPLEKVGVQFVDDVSPFELMKIRILNGGYLNVGYAGALLDIAFAAEAMGHPAISGFLGKLERCDIIPAVPPVPGVDLEAYCTEVEARFHNPKLGDTTARLCADGSNRQPKFLIPTIRDQIRSGGTINGLALASALWCRYCFGTTVSGAAIVPDDVAWSRLHDTAKAARMHPAAWLAMRDLYGDVHNSSRFVQAFSQALNSIWEFGVVQTLETYLLD